MPPPRAPRPHDHAPARRLASPTRAPAPRLADAVRRDPAPAPRLASPTRAPAPRPAALARLASTCAPLFLCAALLACAAGPLDVPRPTDRACRQPATTVQRHAYGPERRAALVQALAPHVAADRTAARVPERLDALATAWVLARADACRTARRDVDAFAARAACQNAVLVADAALVRRLAEAPAGHLARADAVIDELEAVLARCDRPAVLALQRAGEADDRHALAVAGLARALGDGAWVAAAARPVTDPALAAHVRIALAWGTWLQGQVVDLPAVDPDPVARAERSVLALFARPDADRTALADIDAALAAVRDAYGDADLRIVDVHEEAARRLRLAGADADALAHVQAALRALAARRADPTTSPRFATLAQAAGDLEHRLGDYAAAEVSHRAALVGREHLLGRTHLAAAESLHGLANDLEARGRLAEAIVLYVRAATILRDREADDVAAARTYNNLGRALYQARDFAEARRFHAAALAIRRDRLGPDHPDTATSLNNLGAVARAEGDLPGARALFERALAIRERVLGPDHPYTAISLNNVAEVRTAAGDLDGAEPLHRRALAIRSARFGADHPETARSQHNLGALLLQRGDLDAAEPLLRQAATTRGARLGPDHPETRSSLAKLRALAEARARE